MSDEWDKDQPWKENFPERGYDYRALETTVPPKPDLERARPERVDRTKRVLDYNPQVTTPSVSGVPSIFAINSSVAAMGIGGAVPFNVKALITPAGALSQLPAARLAQLAAALQTYCLSGFSPPVAVPLDAYWIMTPGEILEFGSRLIDGVEGFFFAPWSGMYPDQTVAVNMLNSYKLSVLQAGVNAYAAANGGTPDQWLGPSYDPLHPTFGPIFAPVVRVTPNLARPLSMPVQHTPWVVTGISTGLGGNTGASNLCIPVGARYVTITFSTGAGTYVNNQYQGALTNLNSGTYMTPMDANVSWVGFDGCRHSHPGDQLTLAARGQVSFTHDIEVYEIPRIAAMMSITTNGNTGPVPCWSAAFSN